MHNQAYEGAVSSAGKMNGVAALMYTNKVKSVVFNHTPRVCNAKMHCEPL